MAKISVLQSDANGHVIETPVMVASPLEIDIAPATQLTLSGLVQDATGQSLTLSGGGTLQIDQGITTSGAVIISNGTLVSSSIIAGTLTVGNGHLNNRRSGTNQPRAGGDGDCRGDGVAASLKSFHGENGSQPMLGASIME